MSDVMIDLETLSTNVNALVLTLGAIKFDRSGPPRSLKRLDTFYRRIEIQSCIDKGLHISQETKDWWDVQNKEARYEAFIHKDRLPLAQVLKEFSTWFKGSKYIWSHGATFDCVILEEAYKACNLEVPWMFWNTRDTRTLFDISGVNMKDFRVKVEHHALYDAFRQVLGMKTSLERLRLYKKK